MQSGVDDIQYVLFIVQCEFVVVIYYKVSFFFLTLNIILIAYFSQ